MESLRRLVGAAVAVAVLCLATAAPAVAAEGPRALTAAVRGQVIDAPGTDARAELVSFGADLAPSLLRIAPGESVRIAGWPVAPELRSDVTVTRFEVYAPDARIWKVGPEGMTEVPRSRMAFFLGRSEQDPDTRVFLSVAPDAHTFQGLAVSPDGTYDLRSHGKNRYLVSVPEYFLPEDGTGAAEPLSSSCGQKGEVPEFLQESFRARVGGSAVVRSATGEAKLGALHTATIAVDTDNELMAQKFADNTTNANDYIASLFAALNVIYERDLNIRLLQGNTFLRVSSFADPYSQTSSGGASSAQLVEVANHWSANFGDLPRALVMMLSGKSSSLYSSSGIAYVPGLCSTSYGYSFTQVFKFAPNTASNDAFVVGHELGHNFGSPHTHCYSPVIDTCYSGEGGCYSGGTSCPASTTINGVSARGTIMSYCHLLGGCSATNVFHPTTVDRITGIITPRIGTCVFAAPAAPTISVLSPVSGPTTGGTSVTITGTGFQSGATVTFGGTAATSVTFNSATQLTAVTPTRSAGLVNVVVTNLDTQSATATNAFTYTVPGPLLVSVNPASGLATGGTTVTLTGSGFQNGAAVTFDGIAASSVTFVSSTQLTAVTPAHAMESVEVRVINPDTQSSRKDPGFFYAPVPAPTALYTLTPCRLINTRDPNGPLGGPVFAAFAERTFDVAGTCGIPADAVALVVNLTVFDPVALGNLSVYPGNAFYLGTSVLNFQAGLVRANNAIIQLATDGAGTITVRNGSAGNAHVILDVMGYLLDDPDL